MQFYKNNVVKGTFILMAAGLLTRIIGFYYRIFLSSRIGAEGMGLYQMIFPLFGLCMALSVSGIQTAISRFVSTCSSKNNSGISAFFAGASIAIPVSLVSAFLLILFGDTIAIHFLHEPRCSILIKGVAISIPFSALHSCINAFFIGKQDALIPGIGQLVDQIVRVICVFIIFDLYISNNPDPGIVSLALIAIAGHIIGELFSLVVATCCLLLKYRRSVHSLFSSHSLIKPIVVMAYPLTLTRVTLSIIHSLEASAIPFFLRDYGLTNSEALSVYGVLTAMAMPFIMFPMTFTNAVSVMLLPTIAAAQADGNKKRINSIAMKTLGISTALGLFCTIFFMLTGDFLGRFVFDNEMAGNFITILAWLCPFIFASSTMGSILNGLGLTKATFYHNMISSCVCLGFIFFAIPHFGIKGYLWGILAGELVCAVLHTWKVFKVLEAEG